MIKRLFTGIAGVYDRMNRILSLGRDRRWRRQAVATVRGQPVRILDLACGTGDFAFALAERFPEAEIVGVDLTPAMLEIARAKNRSPRISFREGNAQALDSDLSPVGLVACAFGFRNFPDRAAALREARRVLAEKGELLVLEFFRPRSKALGFLTACWVRMLAGFFSGRHGSAYRYLTESMRTTVTEGEFVALAAANGFVLAERRFFFPCCSCLRFWGIMHTTSGCV